MKKYRIIVTGGGTGGHVVPLIAVVEELRKQDSDILFVGSGNEMERKAARENHLKYKSVLSGKYRRYFSLANFIDPFKIIIGFFQALVIIISFWPKVIFAKGGYVTFPVVLAGWVLGRPIITHESDVVMGLANKWEAKLAKKVCVGFPIENYKDIPLNKIIYTGNPVRKEFTEVSSIKYQVSSKKPTILITGGSQGSRFLNQTIASMLFDITQRYNIIHIAGKNDLEWLKKNSWPNYELYDFTDKMPELLKKADLIISRAGANTLAEISALAKPSILVPLPSSANNHQWVNAKIYEKHNAAVVISEEGLTAESLKDIIDRLMEDKKMLEDIGRSAKELSQPNASEAIVDEIAEIINK